MGRVAQLMTMTANDKWGLPVRPEAAKALNEAIDGIGTEKVEKNEGTTKVGLPCDVTPSIS